MVDGINNIASQIFSKLNSQDSNGTDDKIEASIWNKFVSDKGGKEISNYIKKENAVKSIISYLTNMSKKLGCTVEELANRWLDKSEANPSEISGEKSKLNSKSVDVPAIVVEDDSVETTPEQNKRFQENVNNSLHLLSDIANGKYKYNISTESLANGDPKKVITLKDGRSISVGLEKNENGKLQISYVFIDVGSTNYNGTKRTVEFDSGKNGGIDGHGRTLCDSVIDDEISQCTPKQEDLDELFKVIIGILGEDIEV